jgi:hypothetical protein
MAVTRNYRVVPRTEIGLPAVVTSSGGSPRPKVHAPAKFVIHHYTGVNVNFKDVGDTAAEIRGIQAYAARVGKPFEYNYVNHGDPDDLVFEYAGPYRAAHSAGENSIGLGVLHLLGTQEVMDIWMADKAKWLNHVFRVYGMIDARTVQVAHGDAPGASTACPGPHVRFWLPEFGKVWVPPPSEAVPPPKPEPKPPVPVDPPDSSNVGHYLVHDGITPWSISAEVYGTGTRWPEVMAANYPDQTPNPGERWDVQGFSGLWTTVEHGEGPWAILDRLFGSNGWNKATGVAQFWQWNGGDPAHGGRIFNGKKRALSPGEKVWVRN